MWDARDLLREVEAQELQRCKGTRQSRVRAGRGASGKAVGAFAPTPLGLLDFVAASRNSLRALRPLRSNRRDESVHEARKRAATKSSKPRRLATMRRGLPGHDFVATWLVFVAGTPTTPLRAWSVFVAGAPTMLARGRRYPAGAHFCGGCDARPGVGRACAHCELTRRACLNEAASGRAVSCATRPQADIAAQSERSVDRHRMSPCRVPLARGGLAANRGSSSARADTAF